MAAPKNWREANRALWDERVAVHLAPGGYDVESLRAGRAKLNAIEERDIEHCPNCGGELKIIAAIEDPAVMAR